MTQKQVTIRLFYSVPETMFYIQIGDHSLYKIPAKIAARISEKEEIEIVHADGVKDMQIKANEKP